MAGIGFELKKLFSNNSIILKLRANLFSSVVIAGPMIMGAILLIGIKHLALQAGASPHQQDLLIVVITYSLLFSLLLINILSYVLSRFVADMVYNNLQERILPSMYGSISLLLAIGAPAWAIFLYLSKLPLEYSFFSFTLFCLAVVVWTQISYISDIKRYKEIIYGFSFGIASSLMIGFILTTNNMETVSSLLASACIGYGVIMTTYTYVLHKHFPKGEGISLKFLEWIDKFPALPFVGFFTTAGLFVHLMLMWHSPLGTQVHGFFYHAPTHDIPALFGFFTILVTTVNFVTSLEVNFYPKYKLYFSLLNKGGSLSDIEKAKSEMLTVLKQELLYLSLRQMFVTIISILLISEFLNMIGLGFTSMMIGLFRVLCIGYAFYAIGNTMLLYLLYFAADKDALYPAATLLLVNTVGTYATLTLPPNFYGFGFVAAAFCMFIVGWWKLVSFTKHLEYHVFCQQPIFIQPNIGLLTRLVHWLESRYEAKNRKGLTRNPQGS
ncbi:MAG: exopolysaccharide Pel transporter PelG [Anaerolineaceae bacterium]|nr:exopolysaccharide Pel transporter PelG [Anaerolineaceae bacterium]